MEAPNTIALVALGLALCNTWGLIVIMSRLHDKGLLDKPGAPATKPKSRLRGLS